LASISRKSFSTSAITVWVLNSFLPSGFQNII
jgi:hypothetical protein